MSECSQLLRNALRHHQAGELVPAASLYEAILVVEPRHADALHLLGVLANQRGEVELGVGLMLRAVAIRPEVAEYHNNLGNAYRAGGKRMEAEASYRGALALDPRNASAAVNLGVLLEEQGRLEEAKAAYKSAVRSSPRMVEAHVALGHVALAMGDCRLAVKYLKEAVRCAPSYAPAHNMLGNGLFELGENGPAKASYARAIELDPRFADARFNLGNVYLAEEDWGTAREQYEACTSLPGPVADVYNNLGLALAELDQPEAAAASFERAIELAPCAAEWHFNFGRFLVKSRKHRRAICSFDRALVLKPDYAKAFHGRGSCCQALGELEPAVQAYRRAIALEPDNVDVLSNLASIVALESPAGIAMMEELLGRQPGAPELHWNLSTALLMRGDYVRGWREYEWRWRWKKFPSPARGFSQPQWQGEELAGATILLHAEQGFGDTIQFVRYAPLVAGRGGRVVLEVQPELKRLLHHVPGVAECIARGEALPEFSVHCPLMSLPLAFGTTLENIPGFPEGGLGEIEAGSSMSATHPECLRVGLVWTGNPKHLHDEVRSVALATLLPLAQVAGVSFVSLQVRTGAEQSGVECWPGALPAPCAEARDFLDTAAIVAGLDLVITVDTAVAHLAGTMGRPVWILNSHIPDWRWGLEGERTPWYPSARLFRRTSGKGWDDVVERVGDQLVRFRDLRRAGHPPPDCCAKYSNERT